METTYFALNPWWEGKPFETGVEREEYLNRLGGRNFSALTAPLKRFRRDGY